MMDEAMEIKGTGVLLLLEEGSKVPRPGCRLKDVKGQEHIISRVTPQDGMVMLLVEGGDIAYFDRLFRDVRVDATLFWIVKESAEADG